MILVTGGTGYIGSHACLALMEAGYKVTVLDNLSNSHAGVIDRLEQIQDIRPAFVEGDIRDADLLNWLFARHRFQAVLHFAGIKAVGESMQQPLNYFEQNVCGTVTLLNAMQAAQVHTIVFSSSATVYGHPAQLPLKEDSPRNPINPYGRCKSMIEDILGDLHRASPQWKVACLRYFNPVGAHESGLIGENPRGAPNNLMPYIAQVAAGQRDKLFVFGNDYPTPDGTGIRDYIHVVDLVDGHVDALKYLEKNGGLLTLNLGTGRGYSVLEVIGAFEKASGRRIPYEIAARREGDTVECWADPAQAAAVLGWKAKSNLQAMCADTWHWQQTLLNDDELAEPALRAAVG